MRLIDADALKIDVMGAIKNAPTISPTVQWHNAVTDPPKEPGTYMTFRRMGGVYNLYQFLDWTNDLYAVNDYDFYDKKNCSGWYVNDSEVGYFTIDVEYWAELPEPPEVEE